MNSWALARAIGDEYGRYPDDTSGFKFCNKTKGWQAGQREAHSPVAIPWPSRIARQAAALFSGHSPIRPTSAATGHLKGPRLMTRRVGVCRALLR
jgi:hypothetical protein